MSVAGLSYRSRANQRMFVRRQVDGLGGYMMVGPALVACKDTRHMGASMEAQRPFFVLHMVQIVYGGHRINISVKKCRIDRRAVHGKPFFIFEHGRKILQPFPMLFR